ncbi:unnamed protein product [Ambrosiozyma monospora]|uniref:Unnamed protein product n=1 Tax=Ambrosiozyma monospora TaxID=43982 RepID=A0ACB5U394_AMBMO|nr:unnamed protein product [Ambrosiozyma monospora]
MHDDKGKTSSKTTKTGNKLSSGSIAGLVVGCVVGVLLALLLLACCWRRRKRGTTGNKRGPFAFGRKKRSSVYSEDGDLPLDVEKNRTTSTTFHVPEDEDDIVMSPTESQGIFQSQQKKQKAPPPPPPASSSPNQYDYNSIESNLTDMRNTLASSASGKMMMPPIPPPSRKSKSINDQASQYYMNNNNSSSSDRVMHVLYENSEEDSSTSSAGSRDRARASTGVQRVPSNRSEDDASLSGMSSTGSDADEGDPFRPSSGYGFGQQRRGYGGIRLSSGSSTNDNRSSSDSQTQTGRQWRRFFKSGSSFNSSVAPLVPAYAIGSQNQVGNRNSAGSRNSAASGSEGHTVMKMTIG